MKWKVDKSELRRWLSAPRRKARAAGFGIHSPFAFSFVREVLRSPGAYYCYPAINNMAQQSTLTPSQLRMLFRVANALGGDQCTCYGTEKRVMQEVCKYAAGTQGCALIAATEVTPTEAASTLAAVLGGGVAVLFNLNKPQSSTKALLGQMQTQATHGMCFTNGHTAVFVGHKHLPRQDFNIWL